MPFIYHSIDILGEIHRRFGADWIQKVIVYAARHIRVHEYRATHSTSREGTTEVPLQAATVNGIMIRKDLPELYDLYKTLLCDLAGKATNQEVVTAKNDLYGINLNIQIGTKMRYECHVDSNPVQGMLYFTGHGADEGGELIVANRQDAKSVEDVDRDCVKIFPAPGRLIFFDARRYAHYVPSLVQPNTIRVAAAMNFYTEAAHEGLRPIGLSEHLGL